MSSIHFPYRPRPDDLQAALVVQKNLDFLASMVFGLITSQDYGTIVVINATTSMHVDFNQALVNPKVSLSARQNMAGVDYWTSSITSTGFDVHVSTAAPPAGYGFDWIARGDM